MSMSYFESFFRQDFRELIDYIKQLVNEIRDLNKNLKKENPE